VPQLVRLLAPAAHELNVEIAPGVALHFLDQPDLQAQTKRWLRARVARQVATSRAVSR
jgi:hypothetical protein